MTKYFTVYHIFLLYHNSWEQKFFSLFLKKVTFKFIRTNEYSEKRSTWTNLKLSLFSLILSFGQNCFYPNP